MAESQYPFEYLPASETALKGALTEPRLGRFFVKGGYNFPLTMEWYLWNARLTKALQFPMHAVEVTLRNALVEHLHLHGAPKEWAFDAKFLAGLAARSPHTRESLNKSKERLLRAKMKSADFDRQIGAVSHLHIPSLGFIDTNDVVAKLPFEFWTNLLGKDFDAEWHLTLKKVFPNALAGTSRRDIWLLANEAKELRNRMAHHEPIFHLPIEDLHAKVLELIGMRCRATREWVSHFSTFRTTLSQEPRKSPVAPSDDLGPSIRRAQIISDLTAPVSNLVPHLLTKDAPGVVIDDGMTLRVVVPADILNWLTAATSIGLADLTESIGGILSKQTLTSRVEVVGPNTTKSAAGAKFYARNIPSKKKPTVLAVTDDATRAGNLLGLVMKDDILPKRRET